MFLGGCLPFVHVYKPGIDSDVFSGATFHRENDPEKGNETPCVESGERIRRLLAQVKSSGRSAFYPTSRTINHELNPDKYYKIFKSHRPNEPESAFYFAIKHQVCLNEEVSHREESSREASIENCSKLFRSQNLYFKATRFRRTCDCLHQLSQPK